MEKLYSIKESTLVGLANAIRVVNGEKKTYTPEEMIEKVTTIMESITYVLVDEDGNEIPAVFVENETIFTATENDIRIGKIAANQNGIVTGTKEIPTYRALEGTHVVKTGEQLNIPIYSDMCEYTHLQSIVCTFNTTSKDSVAAEKVVINSSVYNTGSTTILANVTVDIESQSINLNLTNEGTTSLVVRYTIIKEDA